MKRQLAPSPFASPVLKHPCTVRDDEETTHPDRHCKSSATPLTGLSSLTEVTEDSNLAQPLCLADLCTQTSDLTGITSTTCTGYFNELCLEDSERDFTGISSITENRLHPLHSTAHMAHLGSTALINWHETPVPFSTRYGNWTQPQISGASQIHVSVSGTGTNPSSGLDSGVGGSTSATLSDDQGTEEEKGLTAGANPPLHRSGSQSSESGVASRKVDGFVVPAMTAPRMKHSAILSTIHEGVPATPKGIHVTTGLTIRIPD